VFQVHAVDADGATVLRKRLRRAEVLSFASGLEPCLIGMEACATSHYWARELAKFGHTVKLMPPAYVKPYVKRGKNDATDAEAICEAVTRPNMRFVPVKSADQQAVLMLHRTRALLIRQQTMLANAFRAHLAELGIVVPQGIRHVRALIERVFGEGADAIAPPTPFALGPEIDGADFDLRGRGLCETDSEGLPDMRHSAVQRGKRQIGKPNGGGQCALPRRRRDFSSQGDAIRRPQPLMECCPSQEDSSCLPQHL
jgi:transposase